MVQAEQVGGGAVEPDRALGIALDHDHGIGQGGGGGAVGAQHVEQAALARAHLGLAAVEQVVKLVPAPSPRAGSQRRRAVSPSSTRRSRQ